MSRNRDVIEGDIVSSSALAPIGSPQLITRPRGGVRSSIGDGGYFDASGNRNPVFNVTPASDGWAVFMIWRVYLSALRHHALKTVIGTITIIYGVSFSAGFTLNFLRGDVRRAEGDLWNPVVLGSNAAALLVPTTQGLAGDAHDLMLGDIAIDRDPIKSETVIRAVRVDGVQ